MLLDMNNITKQYKTVTALDHFTYSMTEGVYALLGPNGAGKSTLMNIVSGIIRQTEGTVTYNNQEVFSLGKEYRRILGYLPQDVSLYASFTGRDCMRYFANLKEMPVDDKVIDELLEKVNLLPEANRKYRTYSGGMKQRLAIAVTLLNNPKILIFDEPTAGLDPKERVRFKQIISDLKGEVIIIISTHIVSDVEEVADHVLFLKKGKLIRSLDSLEGVGNLEQLYMEIFEERQEA